MPASRSRPPHHPVRDAALLCRFADTGPTRVQPHRQKSVHGSTQAATLDELHANLKEVLELCVDEDADLRANPPRFVGVQQIEIA